jgi:hypothetical protein
MFGGEQLQKALFRLAEMMTMLSMTLESTRLGCQATMVMGRAQVSQAHQHSCSCARTANQSSELPMQALAAGKGSSAECWGSLDVGPFRDFGSFGDRGRREGTPATRHFEDLFAAACPQIKTTTCLLLYLRPLPLFAVVELPVPDDTSIPSHDIRPPPFPSVALYPTLVISNQRRAAQTGQWPTRQWTR